MTSRFISKKQSDDSTRKQLEFTPQTLAALLQHGVKKGNRQRLEFFFYTDTTAKADALADELEALEYSVECGRSEGDKSLFVITGWTVPIAIDSKPLLDWTQTMCDMGFKHDCEFDGWGTNVES